MGKRLTKEEIVKRFNSVHNDFYSYENAIYKDYDTKLEISCPIHGSFWQTPGNHLKGKGCPFCKGNARMTTEIFIKKAKQIWGNRFDYSKVEYINNSTHVCIIDENGNEYWQKPSNHLSGYDCTINKLDKNLFIYKGNKCHDGKYDYSKVEIIDAMNKVCIICPEHGEFWQTPANHLRGQGCPICGIKKSHEKNKRTTEYFIKKSKEIHGDKYDYSKVEYINNRTKVCIVCPEHGEFWQSPTNHLKGCGCHFCFGTQDYTKEDFVKKAKEIHGNVFDYSKVEYINNHTKVCIICPIHGEFWQAPNNHLAGRGCKKCNIRARVKEKKLYNTLKENFSNIKIIHSYYNASLFSKQELDIYIPKYKIAIEFQGEQHFKPIDFGNYGDEKAAAIFEDNIQRDIKKKQICEANNIKILYFSNVKEDTFLGERLYHDYIDLIDKINYIIKKENEK